MISKKAIDLIIKHEGVAQNPYWPGGQSGITIGIGYDLGYVTVDRFESDWGDKLVSNADIVKLKHVVGLIGIKAKNKLSTVKHIMIPKKLSYDVFKNSTLPLYEMLTYKAFPGVDRLPDDAIGALVSLVYNRGTSMIDKPGEDRRKEMRAIRDVIANKKLANNEVLKEIANQLRLMKRLWISKGLDGLVKRREDEARLVESCIER